MTRRITVGVENNTRRAFVAVVSVRNAKNNMFAVVQTLGVWFPTNSAIQEMLEQDGSTTIAKLGYRRLPGSGPSIIMHYTG
jgi:hypothetical protein